MNTLLNLLSAAAVVVTGAFASTAPLAPEVQAQARPIALYARSVAPRAAQQSPLIESKGQWLSISDSSRTDPDGLQAEPSQRWIF